MQLLLLSEYFLKKKKGRLHDMIPFVGSGFLHFCWWKINKMKKKLSSLLILELSSTGSFHGGQKAWDAASGLSDLVLKVGAKSVPRITTARDEYCMDLFLSIKERTVMKNCLFIDFLGATLHRRIS